MTDCEWQPTLFLCGESSVRLRTCAEKDQLRLTCLKWLRLLLSTLSLTAVTFSLEWFGADGLTEAQMFLLQWSWKYVTSVISTSEGVGSDKNGAVVQKVKRNGHISTSSLTVFSYCDVNICIILNFSRCLHLYKLALWICNGLRTCSHGKCRD